MLEKIDLMLLEDIIMYYTIQNLPKEYEIFKNIHLGGDQLSGYEAMESKLLSEKMVLSLRTNEKNLEALVMFHDKNKRYKPKPTPNNVFGSYTKGGSSYQSNLSPNYGRNLGLQQNQYFGLLQQNHARDSYQSINNTY